MTRSQYSNVHIVIVQSTLSATCVPGWLFAFYSFDLGRSCIEFAMNQLICLLQVYALQFVQFAESAIYRECDSLCTAIDSLHCWHPPRAPWDCSLLYNKVLAEVDILSWLCRCMFLLMISWLSWRTWNYNWRSLCGAHLSQRWSHEQIEEAGQTHHYPATTSEQLL